MCTLNSLVGVGGKKKTLHTVLKNKKHRPCPPNRSANEAQEIGWPADVCPVQSGYSLPILQFIYTDHFGGHRRQRLLQDIWAKPLGKTHRGTTSLASQVVKLGVHVRQACPRWHIQRSCLHTDSRSLGAWACRGEEASWLCWPNTTKLSLGQEPLSISWVNHFLTFKQMLLQSRIISVTILETDSFIRTQEAALYCTFWLQRAAGNLGLWSFTPPSTQEPLAEKFW